MTLSERFWGRINKSGECWEWTGCKTTAGYGSVWNGEKMEYAHRIAYRIENGPFPDEMLVCHHCDNPGCVNPAHLFIGAHKDNMQDSIIKGRNSRGELHGQSRLTADDIHEIRRLSATGIGQAMLAEVWGIDRSNVSLIVNRKRWRHI